jgi:hypothetical protein
MKFLSAENNRVRTLPSDCALERSIFLGRSFVTTVRRSRRPSKPKMRGRKECAEEW